MRIAGAKGGVQPRSATVAVTRDTAGVDFTLCRPREDDAERFAELSKLGCRLVRIDGTVTDIIGTPIPADPLSRVVIESENDDRLQDIALADHAGRFTVWTAPGAALLVARMTDLTRPPKYDIANPSSARIFRVRATADVSGLRLEAAPLIGPSGGVSVHGFGVIATFLPVGASPPYSVDLERSAPVLNQYCQYNRTVGFDAKTPFQARAFLQPSNGYLSFCTGDSTLRFSTANGGEIATSRLPIRAD